ncbi:MAG: FAD:protein FMN transferase [Planctomycetales bacterium]|nr:FAD:protein FMN transferase [Planctomycetales bacterium]
MNLVASLLACCAVACSADEKAERFSQRAVHMGVEFEVVLYAPCESVAKQALAAAFARVAELDKRLSDYDSESELSRLSAGSPSADPVKVSDDLWKVLLASQALAARSEGKFDITIGPLTKLWRRARRQKELPTKEQIEKALESVGYRHLELDEKLHTAKLLKPNMRLDAGGIAKGFAADEALAKIRELGITQALVRASGDIAAGDPPPGEKGWKIGMAPLDPDKTPERFILLKNGAVSTSGDARQHLIVDGKRYSHIIDPQTGYGIAGRSSVSVIAPHGIDADSIASAVSILGPVKGLKLVEETPGAAMLMIAEEDGRQQTIVSKRFAELETK